MVDEHMLLHPLLSTLININYTIQFNIVSDKVTSTIKFEPGNLCMTKQIQKFQFILNKCLFNE